MQQTIANTWKSNTLNFSYVIVNSPAMEKIKHVGIVSFARFQALIGALVGLIFGIIYSFGGLIIDALVSMGWVTTTETPGLSYGTILAFGALIGMPVIGLISGFVAGIAGGLMYNMVAGKFGGISVDLR